MVHNTTLERTIQKKLLHHFETKLKIDIIMENKELFQSQTNEKDTTKGSTNNTEKTSRPEVMFKLETKPYQTPKY